ncbi:hypothetical protein LOK49_LG01G01721 [Camellia lanceoleosa]|uniref:Uncharacterized protein n=1 Tax=Camellia lanceoleosa TaxID=1840588 RepID=A0ACC0J094_9ERIC|nr:hypothetical protein LOK49_LG01G01721 [Camellia lanceoleosa]
MNSGVKDGRVEAGKKEDSRADVALSNDVASIVKDTVEARLHVMEGRDKRVVESAVRKSDNGLGNSIVGGSGNDNALKSVDKFSKKVVEHLQCIDDSIHMAGFIKSLSGPELARPNFNLEVVLYRPQAEACVVRPVGLSLSNLSDWVAQSQFNIDGVQVV